MEEEDEMTKGRKVRTLVDNGQLYLNRDDVVYNLAVISAEFDNKVVRLILLELIKIKVYAKSPEKRDS